MTSKVLLDHQKIIHEQLLKSGKRGIEKRFVSKFLKWLLIGLSLTIICDLLLINKLTNDLFFISLATNLFAALLISSLSVKSHLELYSYLEDEDVFVENNDVYRYIYRIENMDESQAKICLFNLGFDEEYYQLTAPAKFEKISKFKPIDFWTKDFKKWNWDKNKKIYVDPITLLTTLYGWTFFGSKYKVNQVYVKNSTLNLSDTLVATMDHEQIDKLKLNTFKPQKTYAGLKILFGVIIISEIIISKF